MSHKMESLEEAAVMFDIVARVALFNLAKGSTPKESAILLQALREGMTEIGHDKKLVDEAIGGCETAVTGFRKSLWAYKGEEKS